MKHHSNSVFSLTFFYCCNREHAFQGGFAGLLLETQAQDVPPRSQCCGTCGTWWPVLHVDELAVKKENLIYNFKCAGEGILEQQHVASLAPGALLPHQLRCESHPGTCLRIQIGQCLTPGSVFMRESYPLFHTEHHLNLLI